MRSYWMPSTRPPMCHPTLASMARLDNRLFHAGYSDSLGAYPDIGIRILQVQCYLFVLTGGPKFENKLG